MKKEKDINSLWMEIDTAPESESFYAADTESRYFLGSMIDGVFHNASGNVPTTPPTHWMALPKPPT